MNQSDNPLRNFLPPLADWFASRYGQPSPVQRLAWPKIASGHHCLITAPTGSGKTLAAFLWSIDRLLRLRRDGIEGDRILYISPLKALNSDIEINLRQPLAELKSWMGDGCRDIRVALRSGDTSSVERRHQERNPADIFITTPESLSILMGREAWSALLTGFSTLIVDEVHSLVGNKRGALLMGLLELLEYRNGPCQRLALSATVRPVETVAAWFAGNLGQAEGGARTARSMEIVVADQAKAMEIVLDRPGTDGRPLYTELGGWLTRRLEKARGVLLFANSRRQVERTARWVNEKRDAEPLVYVHHGSLAKEIRREVESGFKGGTIRAVAATNSLELGIDIGTVDQVILLGTPLSVSSTLQRIGRSGHRLSSVSRGLLIPWYRLDHVYGLVMAQKALSGDLDTPRILDRPGDVLAQLLLVYMAGGIDRPSVMLELLQRSGSFARLESDTLHQTLELLAGRINGQRHSSLVARIHADLENDRCRLRPHARLLLLRAGGVIGDRGYFDLRHAETGAKIGDLDEEFVWERNIGDVFPFASRLWRLVGKDARQVKVLPVDGAGGILPFWRADPADRDAAFCEGVLDLMSRYEETGDSSVAAPGLRVSPRVAEEVKRLLQEQRQAWGRLPGRQRIVLETHHKADRDDATPDELLLFTFRGARFNRSLALVLEWLCEKKTGGSLQPLANNEGIIVRVHRAGELVTRLLTELDEGLMTEAFRDLLPSRGLTASVFREQAQIAMLIPRSLPGQRGPLWWRRQRSVSLMEALGREAEGCILLDACWRETLVRYFDPLALAEWIRSWRRGEIALQTARLAAPSPMAADLIWLHENDLMYKAEVANPTARPSKGILGELDQQTEVLPFSEPLLERFAAEKWRLLDGMAPADADELSLWLAERRFIPQLLWERMGEAVRKLDAGRWETWAASVLTVHDTEGQLLGFADSPRTAALLRRGAYVAQPAGCLAFLLDWLRFFPVLSIDELSTFWGWSPDDLETLLEAAPADELIRFHEGQKIALRRIVEQLWQRTRCERRQGLDTLEPRRLACFLQRWQERREDPAANEEDRVGELVFRFSLLPLPLPLWLSLLFPGKAATDQREILQRVISRHGFLLRGDAQERVSFVLPEDLAGLEEDAMPLDETETALASLLATSLGEVSSHDLLDGGTTLSHRQILGALKKLFMAGRIVCSRLEGVEIVLGNEADEPPRSQSLGRGTQTRRRAQASAQAQCRISRGWRRDLPGTGAETELEKLEARKELIRLLLDRSGVFFPELLGFQTFNADWPAWRSALAQMEWSGELISGYFVQSARYPQYLLPAALETFSAMEPLGWRILHSAGPASLCGFANGLFREVYPFPRQHGWLVTEDADWGLALGKQGRRVRINGRWTRERLLKAFEQARAWLRDQGRTGRRGYWIIQEIEMDGGDPAAQKGLLEAAGFRDEMGEWVLSE